MNNAISIIEKKRNGMALSPEEINGIIVGTLSGDLPDYQLSALLMAIYFQGMNMEETASLTKEMIDSGIRFDFSDIPGVRVDKHSTGGVGDKISFIVAPLVAAAEVQVPMVSGRGLGHTGGTLDKLESIPGIKTDAEFKVARKWLKKHGLFFIGQTDEFCPADRKIYALRDVTGTVESLPLITSSIMSKKIAEGIDALLLDVKVGGGAFMKTRDKALELARMLVKTGGRNGVKTEALLTDMSQPLGLAVGNALEVIEAVEVLRGAGPSDVRELSIEQAARMLCLAGRVADLEEGRSRVSKLIGDGSGLKRFFEIIEAQGGDVSYLDDADKMLQGVEKTEVCSTRKGYVSAINCQRIGELTAGLGAGRIRLEDKIDHRVGVLFHKKVGFRIASGESILTIYSARRDDLSGYVSKFQDAITISDASVNPPQIIINEVTNVS